MTPETTDIQLLAQNVILKLALKKAQSVKFQYPSEVVRAYE